MSAWQLSRMLLRTALSSCADRLCSALSGLRTALAASHIGERSLACVLPQLQRNGRSVEMAVCARGRGCQIETGLLHRDL